MSLQTISETTADVNLEFIETPDFDLEVWTDQHRAEAAETEFSQSTTFPAERGVVEHPGPCAADLPHKTMNLADRVELLRGPAEGGID